MRKNIQYRVDQLISLADQTLATTKVPPGLGHASVNSEFFYNFRASSLSFINNVYGTRHSYYTDFESLSGAATPSVTERCKGILKAVKAEIEGGWLFSVRDIVSAEIFSDFLEMAEHLLKENYKDASAVMIGSVLEENLRQLCIKNSIKTEIIKDGKTIFKRADLLNSELVSADVYNKLDQKSITSWLDLRNKATHGYYEEYSKEQVEIMYSGVINFISRMTNSL